MPPRQVVVGFVAIVEPITATTHSAETLTDAFGDFRLSRLVEDSGHYRIEIHHALGSASRECVLGKSVYLGEIGLVQSKSAVEAD